MTGGRMRFRWNVRKQREQMHQPDASGGPVADAGDDDEQARRQSEAVVRRVAAEWSALSDEDKADIVEAVAEQQRFMDEHGITDFHGCTRGDWDSSHAPIRDAATIRAETEQLRAIVDETHATDPQQP